MQRMCSAKHLISPMGLCRSTNLDTDIGVEWWYWTSGWSVYTRKYAICFYIDTSLLSIAFRVASLAVPSRMDMCRLICTWLKNTIKLAWVEYYWTCKKVEKLMCSCRYTSTLDYFWWYMLTFCFFVLSVFLRNPIGFSFSHTITDAVLTDMNEIDRYLIKTTQNKTRLPLGKLDALFVWPIGCGCIPISVLGGKYVYDESPRGHIIACS